MFRAPPLGPAPADQAQHPVTGRGRRGGGCGSLQALLPSRSLATASGFPRVARREAGGRQGGLEHHLRWLCCPWALRWALSERLPRAGCAEGLPARLSALPRWLGSGSLVQGPLWKRDGDITLSLPESGGLGCQTPAWHHQDDFWAQNKRSSGCACQSGGRVWHPCPGLPGNGPAPGASACRVRHSLGAPSSREHRSPPPKCSRRGLAPSPTEGGLE